jgi:hypothetical protein
MISKANWKTWVILGAAVALFVTSGGLLMASNMGFKINTSLKNNFALGAAPQGDNWRCLPWNSPNTNFTNLCATFTAQGAFKNNVSAFVSNPVTGGVTNVQCSVGSGTLISAPTGIRIRINGTGACPGASCSPSNVVFVGSSNETASFPAIIGSFALGAAPKADNWICPPYHTTWTKAGDVCTAYGFGVGSQTTVTRIDANTGTLTNFQCPNIGTNFSLVIGESIRIRKVPAGNNAALLPPHF